jgi:hypothetical protein
MYIIFSFLDNKEITLNILVLNTYNRKMLLEHIYSSNKNSSLLIKNSLLTLRLNRQIL